MSTPVEGGRPLLRLRVLGFPVHLDLSFVIVMAVLGYYPGVRAVDLGLWLLITPFAVLVHELGHAVAARSAGARPQIALTGFGGVTSFVPPRPLSRIRSLGIALAGPVVGLAVGVALAVIQATVAVDPSGWQASALRIGIFTCIAWSVLNLLPVLPLDGGQAMRELLPGSGEVRARRAAAVSVVVAVLAAIAAYLYLRQPFVALFMVFFAVTNVLALRRRPEREASSPSTPASGEQAVVEMLWRGQPDRARQVLESLPPSATADLALHGAVLALTGDPVQGHALLTQEVQRRPGDPDPVALLVLTMTLEHDWDAVVGVLQGPLRQSLPRPVIDRAIEEARGTGREDVANRLTVLASTPPSRTEQD